jgi:outer membrane protein W
MRKGFLLISLIFVMISSSYAAAPSGFGVEIKGGSVMLSPATLNTNLKNSLNDVFLFPDPIKTTISDEAATVDGMYADFELGIKYFVSPNFALLLRSDYTQAEATTTLQIDGADSFESHFNMETMYLGVGGRYYFTTNSGFAPYVGADIGMFLNINSFYQIWSDRTQPLVNSYLNAATGGNSDVMTLLESQVIDLKDGIFGAHIEAGTEYMFNNNVGLGVGIGYRIAGAKPVGDFIDVKGNSGVAALSDINYGGLYLNAGLTFYFGGKPAPAGHAAAAKGTGAGAKYEAAGDTYFKAKNFAMALKYYGGAVKLDKGNAGLYKKIGLCYYYMKDMVKAKQYLGYYLKLNPNDIQIKKWLGM